MLSDNGAMPLCGTAAGSPIPAIAVSGYWDKSASYIDDSDSFTFGCINAAIGKCVRWGYQPWATASECRHNSCKTRNLRDWQQACVRLVRADYCGDGIPHTRSGTRINVYDQLGIQQSANPGWEIEMCIRDRSGDSRIAGFGFARLDPRCLFRKATATGTSTRNHRRARTEQRGDF